MPAKLTLQFADNGRSRQVLVDKDKFFIGRTSDNDLMIQNSNLSRRHAQIDRYADIFVISDCGSSNGTLLNGNNLMQPIALKDGDTIVLGGDVEVKVDLETEKPVYDEETEEEFIDEDDEESAETVVESEETEKKPSNAVVKTLLYTTPVLGALAIGTAGLVIWSSMTPPPTTNTNQEVVLNQTPIVTNQIEEEEETPTPDDEKPTRTPRPKKTEEPEPTNTGPKPKLNTDMERTKAYSSAFLRTLSPSDDNPFLLEKELGAVNDKIKSLKNSSALRDNLKSLKQNATAIKSTAENQRLTGAVLGFATLAKMGDSRSDVAAQATSLAPSLSSYTVTIGGGSANDYLLLLSAHEQGIEPGKVDEILGRLSTKLNEPVQSIRTFWKLREHDEINQATYDFIIRFIALGTIAQSPKDFGVNVDAVTFQ
jgi:pSer/pThr/pTyr-binding forkhead associated (FHA) protein